MLFAKHGHNAKTIKTVWLKKKNSGSCSYIDHKKTYIHTENKVFYV